MESEVPPVIDGLDKMDENDYFPKKPKLLDFAVCVGKALGLGTTIGMQGPVLQIARDSFKPPADPYTRARSILEGPPPNMDEPYCRSNIYQREIYNSGIDVSTLPGAASAEAKARQLLHEKGVVKEEWIQCALGTRVFVSGTNFQGLIDSVGFLESFHWVDSYVTDACGVFLSGRISHNVDFVAMTPFRCFCQVQSPNMRQHQLMQSRTGFTTLYHYLAKKTDYCNRTRLPATNCWVGSPISCFEPIQICLMCLERC